MTTVQADALVVGGGLAGIVTALEALRAGKSVTALYELTPVGQAALHVPRRYGQQA